MRITSLHLTSSSFLHLYLPNPLSSSQFSFFTLPLLKMSLTLLITGHIAWHVSAGLYVSILERPDDIRKNMKIPGVMAQSCRDWSDFTGRAVVDQIDSGL